jgi:hypothetical protein
VTARSGSRDPIEPDGPGQHAAERGVLARLVLRSGGLRHRRRRSRPRVVCEKRGMIEADVRPNWAMAGGRDQLFGADHAQIDQLDLGHRR